MSVLETIRSRRSVKTYTDRPVPPDEVQVLLDAVVWAPNHRMTEPWRFYVLGPDAQRVYAELRAARKAEAATPEAAEAVRAKVEEQALAVPRIVAVASRLDEDPEIREEDVAATWMGLQNLLLAAWDRGLAGYIRTGAELRRPELREALGVPDDQRILALVQLGEPAEVPDAKPRTPAAERTRWVD